jgi:4-amino-4-deoxy-L-arabinose transferase-like glycosyltransferase
MYKDFFQKNRREIRNLGILFLLVLLARLAVAAFGFDEGFAHYSRPDTAGYLEPARALAASGEFNISATSTEPMTGRPPLFPLLLAGMLNIFGENAIPVVILLCLLSSIAIIPVYLTGRLFGPPQVALGAAALFGLNLTAIAHAPMLLTDTFFTFFVGWQLYFFSLFFFRKKLRWCFIAVAIAALSVLIRPISSFWIIPAVFLILIMPGLGWRPKIAGMLGSVLIFLAILTPWMYRNHQLNAGFTIDTNTGAMYYQNGAVLLARVNGTSYEAEKQRLIRSLEIEFADTEKYPDLAARQQYQIEQFQELIGQYPVQYIRLHFSSYVLLPDAPTFLELLKISQSDRGTFDVLRSRGLIAAVEHYFDGNWGVITLLIPLVTLSLITYFGALWQLACWIIRKQIFLFFFFLAFVEYFLFLPGPITMPRYHLPALPLMSVMAALGIYAFYEFRHRLAMLKSGRCWSRFINDDLFILLTVWYMLLSVFFASWSAIQAFDISWWILLPAIFILFLLLWAFITYTWLLLCDLIYGGDYMKFIDQCTCRCAAPTPPTGEKILSDTYICVKVGTYRARIVNGCRFIAQYEKGKMKIVKRWFPFLGWVDKRPGRELFWRAMIFAVLFVLYLGFTAGFYYVFIQILPWNWWSWQIVVFVPLFLFFYTALRMASRPGNR